MAYLLDANVFIQAKNLHYGFDFCPAFWAWIIDAHGVGKVFSIEQVGDELEGHEDELADWARPLGPTFFLPLDASVPPSLEFLSNWALSQPFRDTARAVFLSSADYYLVAYAKAHGHIVVTHELPAPDAKRVIKIPDACIAAGVKFLNTSAMLRRERARFILEPRP